MMPMVYRKVSDHLGDEGVSSYTKAVVQNNVHYIKTELAVNVPRLPFIFLDLFNLHIILHLIAHFLNH